MKKEKNIYTIAKEAGVSPATVSRVMTKNARVSEEKEKKWRKSYKNMIIAQCASTGADKWQEQKSLAFLQRI